MTNERSKRRVRSIKIVSGGQTGVDRAALDVALEMGVEAGGWCPAGRRAEDGGIPSHYPLVETRSSDYAERTASNVRDSDATLIFCRRDPDGGTALTLEEARRIGKPVKVVHPKTFDVSDVRAWILEHDVASLNVAGPRESEEPGIYQDAQAALHRILQAYDR